MESINPLLCIGSFIQACLDKVVPHSHKGITREVVFNKQTPDILKQNTRTTVRNPIITHLSTKISTKEKTLIKKVQHWLQEKRLSREQTN